MEPTHPALRHWTLICVAFVLACLVNGAYPYLARIGLAEPAAFSNYVHTYCGIAEPASFPTRTCSCMSWPESQKEFPTDDYVYSTNGYRVAFKLAKECLFVVLVVLALWASRGASKIPPPPWPFLVLGATATVGLVVSWAAWGPIFALMSARSFEFLVLAILGSVFASGLDKLGRWFLLLLTLELVLLPLEFAFGMPTRGCPHAYRASGTLVVSSSLGLVAAGVLAFVLSFSRRLERKFAIGGAMVALLLVLGSRSGTGLVMLSAMAGWLLLARLPKHRALVSTGLAVGLAALLWLLPAITQRPDIYDSLFAQGGRWEKLEQVVSTNGPQANLLGRGLGVGSNQAVLLAERGAGPVPDALDAGEPFYADSTITWLVVQLGAAGLLAFYLMLGWAFVVDPKARLFYFTMAVASLTFSLPEAFPINFMLGLALAHSALEWRKREEHGQGA